MVHSRTHVAALFLAAHAAIGCGTVGSKSMADPEPDPGGDPGTGDDMEEAPSAGSPQNRGPYNQYFGDVNGDGKVDLIQVGANKLFAFNADYEGSPILHSYFDADIARLVVGNFNGTDAKDRICTILTDNTFRCYVDSGSGGLWWGITQGSFIAADEEAIVGDYDGDGAADILVYKPSTGDVRMYTRKVSGVIGFFQPMPDFALGNLAGIGAYKKVYAGEFGQATGRADLLVLDPASGILRRFDSVTDGTGKKTFSWAYDSAAGFVRTTEELSIGRLENRTRDGFVLRDRGTGAVRLKRADWDDGRVLADVPDVDSGGLTQTGHGSLHFAKLSTWPGEPGGTVRDDFLFFDTRSGMVVRDDARWDGSHYVYLQDYAKLRGHLNEGWSGVTKDPWTVVICKFMDQTTVPQDDSYWRKMYSWDTGSVTNYYWDMSFGSRDLSGTQVYGTYTMSITTDEVKQLMSGGLWDRSTTLASCKNAATAAGLTLPASKVIYYSAYPVGPGANGSNVVADSDFHDATFVEQEMGHIYGVNDSASDDPDPGSRRHGDPWDLMSCYACKTTAGVGGAGGPAFNAGNRMMLNLLPAARTQLLTPTSARQTVTVRLAMLDRPEAGVTGDHGSAFQAIRIPISGGIPECSPGYDCNATGNYYTVELRQPRGWDAAFTQDAVFVHKVSPMIAHQSILKGGPAAGELLAGTTYDDGVIRVRVDSIDSARSVATLTITY